MNEVLMNTLITLNRRSALRVGLCATALCLMTLSGCRDPEDKPPEPTGRLQVIHANPEEGSVELLLNDEVLLTVTPGELSAVVELPQGDFALQFRKPGAMTHYLETEVITFGDEVNVLALSTDDKIIYLTDDAPMAEDGTHYVRVLDLSGSDEGMKMFRGSVEVVDLPIEDNVSAFISTEADSDERSYTLSRLTDGMVGAPYSIQDEARVSSPTGGATLVIVQPADDEADDFKLKAIKLR